ncbi:MAG: 4-amino-4-deoxychorismate lyase [Alcanivorax sp.]
MLEAQTFWIDGHRANSLPLPDRGLDFGDGLFETLLSIDGRVPFLTLHVKRLTHGLKILGFPDVTERTQKHLNTALSELDSEPRSMRLTITRGSALRGYAPPQTASPRIIVSANALAWNPFLVPSPAKLGVADIGWSHQPYLAGIKHLNRLEQVLAAGQRVARGWDEAVMLDDEGLPLSVVSGNLFIVKGARLLTPPIERCGIAGTRRELIVERWQERLGLPVRIERFTLADLEAATEVFYCNSLLGFRPVAALGSTIWSAHPVCSLVQKLYAEAIQCGDC